MHGRIDDRSSRPPDPTPGFEKGHSTATVQRLTVLWALNESGLGGLLHAVRSPFTGLLVGGMAILLVRLLAGVSGGQRRVMLKATAIVLLVKFSVSPHSPVNSYLAVGFQGLLGTLMLGRARIGRASILIFSLFCYIQMSLQKLVVMTVLYGFSIWEAIDGIAIEASRAVPWGTLEPGTHASLWLISAYLGLHLAAGLVIGLLAWNLPARLRAQVPAEIVLPQVSDSPAPPSGPGTRLLRRLVRSIPVLAFLVLAWLLLPDGGFAVALRALLRALLMITLWYALISPAAAWLLRRMLRGRASRHAREIDLVLEQLPLLRETARRIWSAEAARRSLPRLIRTGSGLMAWALAGPSGSGRRE